MAACPVPRPFRAMARVGLGGLATGPPAERCFLPNGLVCLCSGEALLCSATEAAGDEGAGQVIIVPGRQMMMGLACTAAEHCASICRDSLATLSRRGPCHACRMH